MEKLCGKCGGNHDEIDCGAIGGGTGSGSAAAGGGPDDSDLASLGGGGDRPFFKRTATMVLASIVGVIVIGGLALYGINREPGAAKAGKAVAAATAKPPAGDTITLGCSIPSVGNEVEARCEWAKDGGVSFAGLRWDGDVLKGTLVVTLTDGRVYRSEQEMEVKVQKTKAPVTFLAQK